MPPLFGAEVRYLAGTVRLFGRFPGKVRPSTRAERPKAVSPPLLVALVLTALVGVSAQTAPIDGPFTSGGVVSLSITIEPLQYSVRDTIPVTYRITNVSKAPLYVPKGFEATACLEDFSTRSPHILAWIENDVGQRVGPGYGASCASTLGVVPTLAQRLTAAVILRPDETVSGPLSVGLRQPSVGGQYKVGVTLRGWAASDFPAAYLDEIRTAGMPLLAGEWNASVTVALTK